MGFCEDWNNWYESSSFVEKIKLTKDIVSTNNF